MEFSILADAFSKMEQTTKRLELTQQLVELFQRTPQEVISRIVYLLQGKLRPDFEGIELRSCREAGNPSNSQICRFRQC